MKTRKVISAILAGACALSALSISATAADKTVKAVGGTSFTVKASVASPEIEVVLPSAVATVINPYGVAVTVKGEEYGADGVTSPIYTVRNLTTSSKIMVSATTTVTAKSSGIEIITDSSKFEEIEEATEKQIAAWVIGKAYSGTVELYDKKMPGDVTATQKKNYLYGNETKQIQNTEYNEVGSSIFNIPQAAVMGEGEQSDQVVTPEVKPNTGKLMILDKATKTNPTDKEVAKYGYGQFQVGGVVAQGDGVLWDTKNDSVTFSLVLNVTPCSDTASIE